MARCSKKTPESNIKGCGVFSLITPWGWLAVLVPRLRGRAGKGEGMMNMSCDDEGGDVLDVGCDGFPSVFELATSSNRDVRQRQSSSRRRLSDQTSLPTTTPNVRTSIHLVQNTCHLPHQDPVILPKEPSMCCGEDSRQIHAITQLGFPNATPLEPCTTAISEA
jgi:hypothetical protein